jgi:capsular polysaccharide biosynthesis protein
MAKLYEAKDFPGIYILQQARIPDKKVKPKRLLIVIIYTLFAFLLSITFAFLREHQERMSKKEKMQWREIKKDLRLSLKTLLIFILIASILILSLIFIKNFQDKDQGEKKISYEIISSEDN